MSAITADVAIRPDCAFIDPASDFRDGLAVLRAYHQDFLIQGGRLLTLAKTIHQHGLNETRSGEAHQFTEYYQLTTRLHHQDEERALFPLIVNQSFLIDGMIERLALDHDEIEELWTELEGGLQATDGSTGRYLELIPRFEKLLRMHIEREDTDFFPIIVDLLSLEQRRELGASMALLRNREFS